jgi:hypothetical protein
MLTKETTPEIKELYRKAMLVFNTERVHEVFSSEVTMVIDRKPDTFKYDIWFYRFKEGPDRIAQITNGGEYMILDSGLREDMVLNCMRGLPQAIQDMVDWVRHARAERAEGRQRRHGYLGRG